MRDWADKETIDNLNLQIQLTRNDEKLALLNRLKNDLLRRHYNLPLPIDTPEHTYWFNRGLRLGVDRQELVKRVMR